MPGRNRPEVDEDLGELPPMDGDVGEAAEHGGVDELEWADAEGGDFFDDSTSEDEPVEALEAGLTPQARTPGDVEEGWLADAAEAEELDVGGIDLIGGE